MVSEGGIACVLCDDRRDESLTRSLIVSVRIGIWFIDVVFVDDFFVDPNQQYYGGQPGYPPQGGGYQQPPPVGFAPHLPPQGGGNTKFTNLVI